MHHYEVHSIRAFMFCVVVLIFLTLAGPAVAQDLWPPASPAAVDFRHNI